MRFPAMTRLVLSLAPMLFLVPFIGAGEQTVTLDEGAFRLLVHGREAGTENFSIRQNGSGTGAVVVARGTVALDTTGTPEELSTMLQVTGPGFRPTAYDVNLRGVERITGRLVGGRFSARILSPAGERMREYLASDGAVLVDDGIAHQYFFLAQKMDGETIRVPMIIPRQSRQVSAEIVNRGREMVTVGGQRTEARRLVVTPTGAPERHIWVDARGRVLQLEIPAAGYAARRTALPR